MPGLSNWKTPSVLPAWNRSNVARSSRGMASMSIRSPVPFSMSLRASSMTVRLRRPSMSILSRPMASMSPMANWVVTSPLTDWWSGRYSTRGFGVMTTPAAWMEAWRTWPSSFRAMAMSWAILVFFAWSSRSSGTALMAASRVASGPTAGMSLAMRSTSGSGTSRTRPTSRMAARAAIVPKVMIWLTLSWPYLFVTYSIISCRRRAQKSMSMSGRLMRSGLRKRSNRRSYSMGSIWVMPRQ